MVTVPRQVAVQTMPTTTYMQAAPTYSMPMQTMPSYSMPSYGAMPSYGYPVSGSSAGPQGSQTQ
jgi:hypothetical protein